MLNILHIPVMILRIFLLHLMEYDAKEEEKIKSSN